MKLQLFLIVVIVGLCTARFPREQEKPEPESKPRPDDHESDDKAWELQGFFACVLDKILDASSGGEGDDSLGEDSLGEDFDFGDLRRTILRRKRREVDEQGPKGKSKKAGKGLKGNFEKAEKGLEDKLEKIEGLGGPCNEREETRQFVAVAKAMRACSRHCEPEVDEEFGQGGEEEAGAEDQKRRFRPRHR